VRCERRINGRDHFVTVQSGKFLENERHELAGGARRKGGQWLSKRAKGILKALKKKTDPQ
jgi:hypothetical protein